MKTTAFIASLCASTLAGATCAATVDVTYTGNGVGEVVNIVSPGYSGGTNCGQLLLSLANSTDSNVADGNYMSFCTDVYQTISTGPNPYNIVAVSTLPTSSPMGVAKEAAIADLYAYAAGAQYGSDAAYACAFQIAIWEIVNDLGSGLDVNAGTFQASGFSGAAGGYLVGMFSAIGLNNSADIVGLGSDDHQDLIIEVPAPGAFALLGVAGLVKSRRRRA